MIPPRVSNAFSGHLDTDTTQELLRTHFICLHRERHRALITYSRCPQVKPDVVGCLKRPKSSSRIWDFVPVVPESKLFRGVGLVELY